MNLDLLPSYLTTVLFSFSVVFAAKSAREIGGQMANLGRTVVALILLATWAHVWGAGCSGPGFSWFLLSGAIGFGLGDMALFGALPRIGPRLAILLTQCLAAPLAALLEYLWLGTELRAHQLGAALLILSGVAVALAPDRGSTVSGRTFWIGAAFGTLSAFGQGMGAVISRKASAVNTLAGITVDGGSAAYQRMLAGFLFTVIGVAALRFFSRKIETPPTGGGWPSGSKWVLLNGLAGPSLGVGCYQWALRTTPSGVVLPIVATSPLVTMLLSWAMDGQKPTQRASLGGVLAVAGAIWLNWK